MPEEREDDGYIYLRFRNSYTDRLQRFRHAEDAIIAAQDFGALGYTICAGPLWWLKEDLAENPPMRREKGG